jgi:serine phosphatase RsbU (regulator of sigma subunit)/predicted transcriptional regulator
MQPTVDSVNTKFGANKTEAEYITKNLLRNCPQVSPNATGSEVLVLLTEHPEIISLPVVDNTLPIGLINRSLFMDEMSKPFRREVFARKSCIAFMEKEPLVVKESLGIQELSFKVVQSGSKALKDGFVITDDYGEYLGIGTGEDVMRQVAELQAEKNRLIMESINYASVIQTSFLRSSREDISQSLADYFIHWEPRDKVGGDYYFCKKFQDGFFIALIDCTGHGVPGAFMTLIMASFLDHILLEDNRHDPAGALASMNRKVKTALGQINLQSSTLYVDSNQSDDGMDTAFCWIDRESMQMLYAGAKTPLFMIDPNDNQQVNIINGDKKGVGYVDTPMDYVWTNHTISLSKGMCIYLTTDGIIDQIGGDKHISYGKQRFSQQLLANYKQPMPEQCELLLENYYTYQGKQRRRDDVSFLGFRI